MTNFEFGGWMPLGKTTKSKDQFKQIKAERQTKIKELVLDGEEHSLDEISEKLDIPKQFISTYLSQLVVERKIFTYRKRTENNTYIKIFTSKKRGLK